MANSPQIQFKGVIMQSNKGRFKCPHEAQAVWNFYVTRWTSQSEQSLFWYCKEFEDRLSTDLHVLATNLHQARLIHGTIYDEDGRIEDKDVAHLVFLSYERFGFGMKESDFYEFISRMIKDGKIRGTIFY
jgi:hypothetical protein